jgi:outer membrane protein TolC
VPLVLALIFLLLYGTFGTLRHAALILVSIPLALLGGVLALHLRGMTLNVSSAVGFIALFGVAVQNGVIMVSALNRARDAGLPILEAVIQGASERLRPVLVTATVAALGLLPAALARGIGSDVQRPLATVVVGGLVTATLLTLVLLPVLYLVVERRFVGADRGEGHGGARAAVAAAVALALLSPSAASAATSAAPAGAPAPLSFGAYVERVLAANPDAAAAREAIAVADAQVAVAKVFPDPELTVGATQVDVSHQGNPTVAGVQLSVPIELGGKRGARVRVARSGVDAARLDHDDVVRGLRAAAANAYAEALHARMVLELKRAQSAALGRLVEINERRFAAGDVPQVAVMQSRVEARQFDADVLAATGDLRAADAAVLQLLGPVAAPGEVVLAGDLRAVSSRVDPARAPDAVESRADVRAARARVEQAVRQVRLEEANRVPDVSVGVGWQHNFPVGGPAGVPAADTVGASLTVPLPLSRVYSGALDAARASRRQAESQLESVRAKARTELAQALARYEAAVERVHLYEAGALADADSVLEKTLYTYQRGGATLVEYLVAQRTAADVHVAYCDALNDRAHTLAAVEVASGATGLIGF